MKTILFAAVAALAVAPFAQAETEFYANGGYTQANVDDGPSLGALTVRGGAFFTENLGVEAQVDFGTTTEEEAGIDFKLENLFSVFGIAKMPVSEKAELFARLGYATGSLEGGIAGISASVDVDGFIAGVGGQYFFTDNIGVRAEYTGFETKVEGESTDGNTDMFSVALVYRFASK